MNFDADNLEREPLAPRVAQMMRQFYGVSDRRRKIDSSVANIRKFGFPRDDHGYVIPP